MDFDFFQDPDDHWFGKYRFVEVNGERQAPEGGMVIQDITHDNFWFARDIRLIGFWLEYETVINGKKEKGTKHEFYELNRDKFVFDKIRFVPDKNSPGLPLGNLYFETYNPVYQISASYKSKPGLFENWDIKELEIVQTFLFSKYSNSPAHEPTGVMQAARFFPLISFSFRSADKSIDKSKPHLTLISIRFDYRLNLQVDRHIPSKESLTHESAEEGESKWWEPVLRETSRATIPRPSTVDSQQFQFAGIFQDTEEATLGVRAQKIAFKKVEKPLIFEVASWGYRDGKTKWDNVHWWGQQLAYFRLAKKFFPKHISAPGAFHAIHCHWRWGQALRNSSIASKVQQTLSKPFIDGPKDAPQFRGFPNPNSPLVHPICAIQDLDFAITKYRKELDPAFQALNKLSTQPFDSLFKSLGAPQDISKGDRIIFWLSPTVKRSPDTRQTSESFRGMVLIHGLFFAHNPEQNAVTIGSRSEEYFPDSEKDIRTKRTWER